MRLGKYKRDSDSLQREGEQPSALCLASISLLLTEQVPFAVKDMSNIVSDNKNGTLEEITPRCLLELLALPLDDEHRARREEGLLGVRNILWAVGGGGAAAIAGGLIDCLRHLDGVVYMAAKKYYFGVGGGSRRFLSVVEKDGVMTSSLVAEITNGSSNVREVWKLAYK